MLVAEAAPNVGVTIIGEIDPTNAPVPVLPESPTPTALIVLNYIPLQSIIRMRLVQYWK